MLPIGTMPLRTFRDVDEIRFLLNFDRIRVFLAGTGRWHIYYDTACRELDPETYGCRVHGTLDQPEICRSYDPFHCLYRPAFDLGLAGPVIEIDDTRLALLLEAVGFDDERRIVDLPSWPWVLANLGASPLDRSIPPRPTTAQPAPTDAAGPPEAGEWRRGGAGAARRRFRWRDPEIRTPCVTCAQYCCTSVTFPTTTPETARDVDYLNFLLGFEGVEVLVEDDAWDLTVATRCRHLSPDGRCRIFGQPERPVTCALQPALGCPTRARVAGEAETERAARLDRATWARLLEEGAVRFDEHRRIVDRPTRRSLLGLPPAPPGAAAQPAGGIRRVEILRPHSLGADPERADRGAVGQSGEDQSGEDPQAPAADGRHRAGTVAVGPSSDPLGEAAENGARVDDSGGRERPRAEE